MLNEEGFIICSLHGQPECPGAECQPLAYAAADDYEQDHEPFESGYDDLGFDPYAGAYIDEPADSDLWGEW